MTVENKALSIRGMAGLLVTASVGACLLFAAPGLAEDRAVQSIDVQAGATERIVIQLNGEAEGSAVSFFQLPNPPQVVIDVADTTVSEDVLELVKSGEHVDRVEVESLADPEGPMSRIRLYLKHDAEADVKTEGKVVTVTLTAAVAPSVAGREDPVKQALGASASSAPAGGAGAPEILSGPNALPTGPSLATLDFKNLDTVSRVIITTNQTIQYTASQPQQNLIVLDFKDAFVPKSLERPMDTSEFISPVRLIRAYKTSTGARVAISLRASTDYKVTTVGDKLIQVDVTVPQQMLEDRQIAAQGFSTVSPSQTSNVGRLENAYQSEQFISSSGRSVDPKSVFGIGAGANDPSSLLGFASGFLYDSMSAQSLPYSGQRISMDFVNADIHSIFRLISDVARLNIIASDEVQGTVTVKLDDVPWDQALAAVLQSKGLGSQRFGNIIRVAPIESIKSEQQTALAAKQAKEQLEEPDLLILPLNYAQAVDVMPEVQSLVSSRGSVQIDTRGNQLILKETAQRLAQIRELVRHLDKQTPQVTIEARVVEASSGFTRSLGIQWGGQVDASAATGSPTGWAFPNDIGISGGRTTAGLTQFYTPGADSLLVDLGSQAGDVGSLALSLGSISGVLDLDARLSALEADGFGKVISSPKITTIDNKQATISQGTQIPFLSTSSTGTSVQFVTAALELAVTPHITNDDRILMIIAVSNNRADFGLLVNGQPAIQIKRANTELLVQNGDTTVLGGVFATEESWSQTRIPGFWRIPLLGYLFRNSAQIINRNELLVFITPHIVTRAMAKEG
jgi:type IV pilus assembly protein PilQ